MKSATLHVFSAQLVIGGPTTDQHILYMLLIWTTLSETYCSLNVLYNYAWFPCLPLSQFFVLRPSHPDFAYIEKLPSPLSAPSGSWNHFFLRSLASSPQSPRDPQGLDGRLCGPRCCPRCCQDTAWARSVASSNSKRDLKMSEVIGKCTFKNEDSTFKARHLTI